MKKLILFIFLLPSLVFGQVAVATHAADFGSVDPSSGSSGDVVGPASSTDKAIARWEGTTGKLLQDSSTTLNAGVFTAQTSNQGFTFVPNGTGTFIVPYQSYSLTPPFVGVAVVSPSATESGFLVDGFGDGNTPRFVGRNSGGTPGAPNTAVASGRLLVSFSGRGNDGTGYSGTAAGINMAARGDWSSSNHGTSIQAFYTPQNTLNALAAITIGGASSGIVRIGDPSATTDQAALSNIGFIFNTGAGMTFRDVSSPAGAVTLAVANSFNVPTHSALNAITIANAANLYIAGDLAAGTNVTLTNSYGLLNDGKTKLVGPLRLGNTGSTPGSLVFVNATSGTLSIAPPAGALGTVTNTLQAATDTFVYRATTDTLTNKRITARITTITSSATPTINTDNCDCVTITALAEAITSMTTNLSGTPNNFDKLLFRIKDDGTGRAITWGASFASRGATLPTTTTANKVTYVGLIWNSVESTWDCVASATES